MSVPETADGDVGPETVAVSPGRDIFVGALSLVGGVLVLKYGLGLPPAPGGGPGSGLVPAIIGALASAVGAILMLLALLRLRRESAGGRSALRRQVGVVAWLRRPGSLDVVAVLSSIAFYIAFIEILGFLITMATVQFGLMVKFRWPPISSAIISVVSTVVLYYVFNKLLFIPLQDGVLGPVL